MHTYAERFPRSRVEIINMLKEHKISPTAQRVEIANFLFQKPQHTSAESVLEGVNHSNTHVSKATVYNTLGLFVKRGIVREVLVNAERVFYDSNVSHHHHLYNIETGTLTDISTDEVDIQRLPTLPDDLELDGVELVIRVRSSTQESPTTH